jgi:pyruvate,water dikinase
MPRIAAIVTEVGSPVGHMAIIARELDLPCIVGLRNALGALREGAIVTVDAFRCRVLPGAWPLPPRPARVDDDAGNPDRARLRRIAACVSPLRLTNPSGPDFTPDCCQSLHDITRFVHEKVFGVMFHFGDLAESDRDNAVRLEESLPFKVLVYDVGGGLDAGVQPLGAATREQICSIPLRAFLDGLLEARMVWNQPRPVSGRGFLSVLGESMAGPPPDVQRIGRTSYAVISDRYLNFSTKAGYHFSTVDTYCGASLNKNYIHFRFAGGAARADRRERRVRFLQIVLDALDFSTRPRGDILVARLEKYEREAIELRLRALGRLTIVTRQLDMLMDSDASPDFFARAFLEDRLESF